MPLRIAGLFAKLDRLAAEQHRMVRLGYEENDER